MRRVIWGILTLTVFVLITSACAALSSQDGLLTVGQNVNCQELVEETILALPFDAMTVQEAQQWITDAYGIQAKDSGPESTIRYLSWRIGDRYRQLTFRDLGVDMTVLWEANSPAVTEVFRCLGEPEFYQAYYSLNPGGIYTILRLWYPHNGVNFVVTARRSVVIFDGLEPVTGIGYTQPGSLEETVLRTMVVEANSDLFKKILSTIRPWPGSLKKVEIDERLPW